MREVAGSTAFITGAASGIGYGIAQALAAAGARIVVADIDAAGGEHAAASLRDGGAEAIAISLDVRSPEAWAEAADLAEARFGAIHIFCSNAGVGAGKGNTEDRSLEDLDWVWDVNARAMLIGVKTMLPRIRAHGQGGHIVITASVMGLFATPGVSLYIMSKYAAIGLAETLYLELKGTDIGVSALCPGVVNTALLTNVQKNMPSQRGNSANAGSARFLESAMPPIAVGEHVVQAIRNDNFYIITHPEYRPLIADRFEMLFESFGQPAAPDFPDDLSFFTSTYRTT